MTKFYCPKCGSYSTAKELRSHGGYCETCEDEHLQHFLEHEFAQARWDALSNLEKDAEIRRAA